MIRFSPVVLGGIDSNGEKIKNSGMYMYAGVFSKMGFVVLNIPKDRVQDLSYPV